MSKYGDLIKMLRKEVALFNPSAVSRRLALEAADAIENLEDAIEDLEFACNRYEKDYKALCEYLPKWIPCSERLPEEDTDVLVVRKFLGVKGQVPPSTYVEIASRYGDDWAAVTDEYKIARSKHTNPLYWMPLPEPPEKESES